MTVRRRPDVLPPAVFLDTSYLVALFVPRDEHHETARALSALIRRAGTQLVTTHAVALEIGNTFARPAYRAGGQRILRGLETDSFTRLLPVTEARYAAGRTLFDGRPDQTWGLTDCVSFAVMAELGLTAALTADRHFEQAGYRALLREAWERANAGA